MLKERVCCIVFFSGFTVDEINVYTRSSYGLVLLASKSSESQGLAFLLLTLFLLTIAGAL